MADPKEPKKETVRITLPPRVSLDPTEAAASRRDTVRINMPARPPANGIGPNRPPPPTPVSQSPAPSVPAPTFLPPPISAAPSSPRPPSGPSAPFAAAAMPATDTESVSPGPKKETARIAVLPDPPKASGSVQMKKTQPLISVPAATAPVAPVTFAPKETPMVQVDETPMALYWTLLGASAVILLIQIWNYLS